MKHANIAYLILLYFSLILLASSCEKNIQVEIPEYEEKIVVEGWIEPNEVAYVMLTKNSAFFSTVDSAALTNMLISDAIVTVSNGTKSEQLTLTFDPNYAPPILYKGSTLKGEVGKTYTLKIEVNGKILTSSTTIPKPISLDSVWFKVEPDKDSLGYIWGSFSDPANEINFYRLSTKRIGKDKRFIPIMGAVYEDKFFNGQSFIFSINRGLESYTSEATDPEFMYFKIGDTVIVKTTAIDYNTFAFWRSAEMEMFSSGNPFATPTYIPTNIEGGALGVWGGYGVSYDTIIANR